MGRFLETQIHEDTKCSATKVTLTRYRYGARPPTLPGDGETVRVKPADWAAGKDTLVLMFPTRPATVGFLIVSHVAKRE